MISCSEWQLGDGSSTDLTIHGIGGWLKNKRGCLWRSTKRRQHTIKTFQGRNRPVAQFLVMNSVLRGEDYTLVDFLFAFWILIYGCLWDLLKYAWAMCQYHTHFAVGCSFGYLKKMGNSQGSYMHGMSIRVRYILYERYEILVDYMNRLNIWAMPFQVRLCQCKAQCSVGIEDRLLKEESRSTTLSSREG